MPNKHTYETYRRRQLRGYEVTHQEHQGKNYLVVPVVMMVEGVHHGSHGPLLHQIEELGRFPESWNGIPITIDHPEIQGTHVSANIPDVIDARMVGRVYNTRVDGTKLVAQAWLDEERLRQISAVVLAQVEAGEPIEVSLGMFTEELTTTGEYNGEQYEAIARNHRPDHLALLPGGTGACSIADGCGIRANNKKGGQTQVKFNGEDFIKVLKDFNKEGYSVNNLITDADQGYRELVDAVRQKLDSMDSESSIHFLQEVYDDSVIYEVRMRVGGSRLFKQGYTFNGGVVELQGSPTEVRKKTEYIAMAEGSGRKRTRINSNKEVKEMAENAVKCTPCVKKKVDELIANSQGKYTEDDREMLETLNEAILDKMAKPIEVEKVVEKEVTKTVEVNKLTPEDQAALDFGKRQLKERRDGWIQKIQANTKDVWTDEELKTMSDAHLEKLAQSVKKEEVVDYSLNTGFQTNVSVSTVEPLYPAGVEPKK